MRSSSPRVKFFDPLFFKKVGVSKARNPAFLSGKGRFQAFRFSRGRRALAARQDRSSLTRPFFFEKKNQETFNGLRLFCLKRPDQKEVFLVPLFLKKRRFYCFPR